MYELFCLISSKVEKKDLSQITGKIEELIKEGKGNITKKKDPEEKQVAYLIKKEKMVYTWIVHFEFPAEQLKLLKEKLKNIDKILRFQVFKVIKPKPEKIRKEPKKEERKKRKIETTMNKIFDKLDI